MDTKEVINKIKALLGIAEKPAEAPVETAPEEPKQPEALAEEAPKEEEKPTETAPENAEEKPAEEKPAEETPEVEKRVAELEGKVDELYGVVQALVEKITVEGLCVVPIKIIGVPLLPTKHLVRYISAVSLFNPKASSRSDCSRVVHTCVLNFIFIPPSLFTHPQNSLKVLPLS